MSRTFLCNASSVNPNNGAVQKLYNNDKKSLHRANAFQGFTKACRYWENKCIFEKLIKKLHYSEVKAVEIARENTIINWIEEYIKRGKWNIKEDLRTFLLMESSRMRNLLSTINLSDEEKNRCAKMKSILSSSEILAEAKEDFLNVIHEYGESWGNDKPKEDWPRLNHKIIGNRNFENSGGFYFTRTEIDFYQQNGVVGPIKLTTLDKRILESLSTKSTSKGAISNFYFKFSEILKLVKNTEILSKVRSILGDNVVFINDTILVVPPGDQLDVTHSDIQGSSAHLGTEFYRGDSGILNVWISITEINKNNSPLHVFPSTHLWGISSLYSHLTCIKKNLSEVDYYSKLLALEGDKMHVTRSLRLNAESILEHYSEEELSNICRAEIYTEPGECVFFNGHIIHGSTTNDTDKVRIAVALRYRVATAPPIYAGFTKDVLDKIYSEEEIKMFKMPKDGRKAIIQVLGDKHHNDYCPIDTDSLIYTMENRGL